MGDRTCSVEDCTRVHAARGYCQLHWVRWRKHGDPLLGGRPNPGLDFCDVDGCDDRRHCQQWCLRHYKRWMKWGDPAGVSPKRPLKSRGDGKHKRCTDCQEVKELAAFSPSGLGRLGLRGDCKTCTARKANQKYHKDPETYRRRAKEWAKENPDKIRATARRNKLASYGLTFESFAAKLESQSGRCASCLSDDPRGWNWAVDHCHVSGQTRGILCNPCNTALGLLRDDPELAVRLAQYRLQYMDVLAGSLVTTSQVHEEQGES